MTAAQIVVLVLLASAAVGLLLGAFWPEPPDDPPSPSNVRGMKPCRNCGRSGTIVPQGRVWTCLACGRSWLP